MPTNRKRRRLDRRQQIHELDDSLRRHLVYGSDFFPDTGFQDMGVFRFWWQSLRDVVMSAWIEQCPCTRPFAWWLFVGVPRHGERRVVDPGPCQIGDAQRRYGILHTHAWWVDAE